MQHCICSLIINYTTQGNHQIMYLQAAGFSF
ncbi:hypothetical protein [Salmonella phage SD-1_S14]|nr:hypothetical protein [Salmonella phage SD-1_S14]